MSSPLTTASMSKEKLRGELQARNIPLPPANSKKDVYVQLYDKHIAYDQNRANEFSSDEEDSTRRTSNDIKTQRSVFTSSVDGDRSMGRHMVVDGLDISLLSDDDLRQRLLNYNVPVGPVVETTRIVYEKKLAQLLRGKIEGEVPNGKHQKEDFSDSEEEVESSHSFASPSLPSPPLNTTYETRKKKTEETITPKLFTRSIEVPDNVLTNRGFLRDTPTPRRSLRDNISYTPTDRLLYADLINREQSTVSNLASNVVENTPEPMMKANRNMKSTPWLSKIVVLLFVVAILAVLVYYTMEKNDMEEISHLPGTA